MASRRLRKLFWLAVSTGGTWIAPGLAKEPEPDVTPTLPAPLQLQVIERGPELPWSFQLTNVSEEYVGLFGDPRLLWFDVVVPGETRPKSCRLPADMLPTENTMRSFRILAPGESYVRHLDPRFYCFGYGTDSVLVPGAVVKPRFGWPDKIRTVWKHGKRLEETLPAKAPFVAFFVDPPEEEAAAPESVPTGTQSAENPVPPIGDKRPTGGANAPIGEGSREGDQDEPGENAPPPDTSRPAQKNAQATAFALNSEYRVWSEDGLDADGPDAPALGIAVTHGSDAVNEREANITISLKNRSARAQTVYFRRELARLRVQKPAGIVECPGSDEARAPSELSFIPLGAGQSISMTARLVEMCPRGTFARPGLYLVNIEFDAEYAGHDFGLDAFTGKLRGRRPVPVRIRNGELPFLVIRATGREGSGGGGGVSSPNMDVAAPPSAPPPQPVAPPPPAPAVQ